MVEASGPLAGIKVMDVTINMAGPTCSRISLISAPT